MNSLSKQLRLTFEDKESKTYHLVNDILAIIILASIVIISIESVESIYLKHKVFFYLSEIVIVSIFTIEYLTYIYLAPKKWKYIFSFFGIIDLLAILPTFLGFFFLPLIGFKSLRVLRIVRVLRLLRIVRLLKLVAYTKRRHLEEKPIIKNLPWYDIEVYLFTLLTVIIISGSFMHLIEGRMPGSQFSNIPNGIWWAVVTLTTVGYGDIIPQSVTGKFVAAFVMILGVMLFAMLVSVMGKVMQRVIFGTKEEIIEPKR